jgi:hypothetical protein
MRQASVFAAMLVAALLAFPALATAQSSIVGVVKDTSGAVLPGVTVEASSDVLIEKSKSAVSDGNGQYRIVDLRPGSYVVVFTLTGFQTFKREGIELLSEFTANVNAEMKVGAIEETIVVSAASPIVDVSSAAHIQVLDRDSIDNIPTGRTIQGIGQVLVGVNLSLPDVGGSRAAMQTYMSVHGQSAANNTVMVDGLSVNGLEANGAVQSYFNDAASQEMSYQTSAIGAETSSGGVRLNMIPREGGNRFSGDTALTYRPGSWQGDNLTQRLINRGLTVGNSTKYIADFTASEGGPILKDKLWFFGSYRDYDTNNRISNTFFDDGSQGDDFNYIKQGSGRITYQVRAGHKVSGFYDRISKYRAHDMQSLVDPESASVLWTSPDYHTAGVKYTGAISTRILVEGGYSENIEFRNTVAQDGIQKERNSPEWFAGASRTPNTGSGRIGAPSPSAVGKDWPERRNVQASLSYVTGSHHVKAGAQLQWGTFFHENTGNADLIQRYRTVKKDAAGAIVGFADPVDVRPYNTPVQSQERLNADLGVFAQDSWTIRRLTVNAGIRWEYLNSQVDTMTAPAGRFVPARTSPEIVDLPNWRDWAPRLQVAYDLFGTAKTAVKYSANRYNAAQSVGVAATFNALGVTGATSLPTLAWTDLNNDDIAQGGRQWSADGKTFTDCVYLTAGCEINLAQLSRSYGLLSDPGVYAGYPRGYNIEQGLELQHELLPGLSLTATYYRGYNKQLTTTINRAVTPADYTKVTTFNPIDGSPIDYYNISAEAQGRASDNITFLDPDRFNRYQSYSGEFRARPGRGAVIFGGVSWERELANATSATAANCTIGRLQNPNQLRFCDRANLPTGHEIPFSVNGRLNVTYPLPWQGINVSASYQNNDGGSQTVSYQFDRTTRYPDGVALKGPDGSAFPACVSPCAPGGLVFVGLTPASATVNLFPTGSKGYRNERLNQLDLKVSKTFRVGRIRISPAFEAFNINNADTIISYSSQNYATTGYLSPNSILQGRILGVGTSVKW